MIFFKYKILILFIVIFTSCQKNPPFGDISLPPSPVFESSNEKAKKYAKELVKMDIKPIYLFIENNNMRNESGGNVLPKSMLTSAKMSVHYFYPRVRMITSTQRFLKILANKIKHNRAFEIEGALTSYNVNKHILNKSNKVRINITGPNDFDGDARDRDVDKISSLTLKIFFKQNGEIFTSSEGTIDIIEKNRGYTFGLFINRTGIGMQSYQNKKQGIGESIDRLLLHTIKSMIQDVVKRKNLARNINYNSKKIARNKSPMIRRREHSINSNNSKNTKIKKDTIQRKKLIFNKSHNNDEEIKFLEELNIR